MKKFFIFAFALVACVIGTYKIDGDMVDIHYTGFSWTNDGEHMEEQTDFEPYDDHFKYAISGNTLTIIRGDNTETYTKQ